MVFHETFYRTGMLYSFVMIQIRFKNILLHAKLKLDQISSINFGALNFTFGTIKASLLHWHIDENNSIAYFKRSSLLCLNTSRFQNPRYLLGLSLLLTFRLLVSGIVTVLLLHHVKGINLSQEIVRLIAKNN